jgi:hypothetical protein
MKCNKICDECVIALEKRKRLIEESDSIFDAVSDYEDFIKNCKNNNKIEKDN